MAETSENKLNLVWGAPEIAKIIGRSRRVTHYLLEKGEIPAKKVGGRWVAERNQLAKFFLEPAA